MTEYGTQYTLQNELQNPMKRGQRILFQPGVQIRMSVALILVVFSAILPWIVLLYLPFGIYLAIAYEIFLTLPLFYGLSYMARLAADGKAVSVRDLFTAFSACYGHAIWTILWFIILSLLPFLIPVGIVAGSAFLGKHLEATAGLSGFSVPILLLGIMVAIATLFPVLLLQIPSYLMMALRTKHPSFSCFRAVKGSLRLFRKELPTYLKLRMQLLLLSLISCASVCALFPIYTLPLYFCITAGTVDLLEEKKQRKAAELNFQKETN